MKPVRERLIDVAERLFAEKGFDGVGVREITAEAGCNVAAVNYHFGNKKGLYIAVFKERMVRRGQKIQEIFWKELENDEAPEPERIIKTLAKAFLKSPFSEKERMRHHKLMERELNRPTKAFDIFYKEVVIPFFRTLLRFLKRHLPEDISEQTEMLYILSIISQVLYFNLARNMITRITGQKLNSEFIDCLIEHIGVFTLFGLKGKR